MIIHVKAISLYIAIYWLLTMKSVKSLRFIRQSLFSLQNHRFRWLSTPIIINHPDRESSHRRLSSISEKNGEKLERFKVLSPNRQKRLKKQEVINDNTIESIDMKIEMNDRMNTTEIDENQERNVVISDDTDTVPSQRQSTHEIFKSEINELKKLKASKKIFQKILEYRDNQTLDVGMAGLGYKTLVKMEKLESGLIVLNIWYELVTRYIEKRLDRVRLIDR